MVAPEGEPPIGIGEGDIVELVGGANGGLIGDLEYGRLGGAGGGGESHEAERRPGRMSEDATGGGAWEGGTDGGRGVSAESREYIGLKGCHLWGKKQKKQRRGFWFLASFCCFCFAGCLY